MSSSFSGFSPARDPRRGIALLVTIVLLVFLVLVVAALSSLVRIETQIAVNTDHLAQARQNALYAADVALGRIQETLGPDRRFTARADILSPTPDNAYLTGVWDDTGNLITWLVNGNENHNAGSPVVEPNTTSTDKNLASALILDPTDAKNNSSDNRITNPIFDDVNPPANIPANPANATGQPIFAAGHVYLVSGRLDSSGENLGSVDVAANFDSPRTSLQRRPYKDGAGERIILRKSPILVDGGSVPGRAAGTRLQVGSYAFWVSDDGMKASIGSGNMAESGTDFDNTGPDLLNYDDSGATPAGIDYNFADNAGFSEASAATDESYLARKFLNSLQLQQTRVDLVLRNSSADNTVQDLFNTPATGDDRRALYGILSHPASASFLRNLASVDGLTALPVLTDFSSASVAPRIDVSGSNIPTDVTTFNRDLRDRLRQRFHDITPKSLGVLTDTINGGLREDLTFEVANGFPDTPGDLQPGLSNFLNLWRKGGKLAEAADAPAIPNTWIPDPANPNIDPLAMTLGNSKSDLLGLELADMIPPPKDANGHMLVSSGAHYYSITPVISEFVLSADFEVSSTTGELTVRFEGAVELWNPYNVLMNVPENLYLSIPVVLAGEAQSTLSEIQVGVSSGTPPEAVDLARTIGWDGSVGTATGYMIIELGGTAGEQLEPGHIRRFDFTLDRKQTKGVSGDDIVLSLINPANPNSGYPTADTVSAGRESKFSVELRTGNPSGAVSALDFVFGSDSFFADTDPLYAVGSADSPLNFLASTGQDSPAIAGFFFRLADQEDYAITDAWLSEVEPRGPRMFNRSNGTGKPDNYVTDGHGWNVTPGRTAAELDSEGQQLLKNTNNAPNRRVVLYDVPRQEIVSIGALQHLTGSGRSYEIGGRGTGSANDIFDTHFISTVPQDTAMAANTPPADSWRPLWRRPLANTNLRVFDPEQKTLGQQTGHKDLLEDTTPTPNTGLQTARAAENLLIEDAFNINSTSVAAWKGVLGGALPNLADPGLAGTDGQGYVWGPPVNEATELMANWRYRDASGTVQTQPLANVFFRLPNTATNLGRNYNDILADFGGSDHLEASYRLGLRSFTKDEIDNLANNLVGRIKGRGKPFVSISEFVGSGILQDAINDARLNELGGTPIAPLSTAYLSQGDILQLIAPRLAARSDTFTIRAYGDVSEPTAVGANADAPVILARAWVEVTVQRLPVKHKSADDPDDNMKPTGDGANNFGRRFKVIGMRWLSPDEI